MNESMDTCCEQENTKRMPRDTFLMANRRRAVVEKGEGKTKRHMCHTSMQCFPRLSLRRRFFCIHILGASPPCRDFDSAASKSTQVNAMRCDVARLESSRVILHLKCRQRVLLLSQR